MNSNHRRYHTVLTIGHSDPAGASGIQADVKTIAAFGCYPCTVVSAIWSRFRTGSDSLLHLDTDSVLQQCEQASGKHVPGAIKIGLVGCAKTASSIASFLSGFERVPVLLDPVFARLSDTDCTPDLQQVSDVFLTSILPHVTLLLPSVPEAEYLTGTRIRDGDDMERAARTLLDAGPKAVLLKGGKSKRAHSDDVLAYRSPGEPVTYTWFHSGRVREYSGSGAGSTLSSAIAAGLARGKSIRDASEDAKIFLTAALRAGSQIRFDSESGGIHHFYAWWNE